MKHRIIPIAAAVAWLATSLCSAQQLSVAPDKAGGIYQVGETVHWRVEWKGDTSPPPVRYTFLKGGLTDAGQGGLSFSNHVARLETTFDAPGTMLVEVKGTTAAGGELRATGGAVAAPDRIGLSASRPADFDAFWTAKLQELGNVPANPKLESVDMGMTNLSYWKITMDNIRGTHIQGQLARPASGGKFPALLIVQWAGVYALQTNWVTDRAADGWLVLNIEPHDLPIDRPEAFYKEQFAGPLKDYWSIGNDNRDTSYYLRMFLSCYRAAEYLAGRPDWDGKTLVVMGASQGGMQSLMTAGLHPRITAALALVPAGCDMLGPDAGRKGGWPQWYANTDGKDPAKVHEASRYYDVANFAVNIKCPVLVGLGLIDETCPPAGVLAAVNQIVSPKEVVILPQSGHQDNQGTQGTYDRRCWKVWLPDLRAGKPAPVNVKTFIDYFLPTPVQSALTSNVWGAAAVGPRDPQNGLEDETLAQWNYWDGQIVKAPDGKYHLFASRWDQAKGHGGWGNSKAVHAVSDTLIGPYADQGLCWPGNQGGKGHNVTALALPDGRYAVVISETRPGTVFVSKSLDGPWEQLGLIQVATNEFSKLGRMSNVSLMVRPDGGFEIVPRSGAILISTNGILGPYTVQGPGIYPKIAGLPQHDLRHLEDPVVWYSGGRYHIVVNNWSDRKAYHLTSPDGIHDWTYRGLAYDPTTDVVRYTDGTVNHWEKMERPGVLLENGHVTALTLAVLDVPKEQQKGNDRHGSKVIVVPFDGAALDRDLQDAVAGPSPAQSR